MSSIQEIRKKFKSVENTKKITKAMEMVAASKMRKIYTSMYASRPYSKKIGRMISQLLEINSDYNHPYLLTKTIESAGLIVISTDKGLCGGLNNNLNRLVLLNLKHLSSQNITIQSSVIGLKALNVLKRTGTPVISYTMQLGNRTDFTKILETVKVQFDHYMENKIQVLYLATTRFFNTMKQKPVFLKLLPFSRKVDELFAENVKNNYLKNHSQYLGCVYEPNAKTVIDNLLQRYTESIMYQAIVENIASEQSARMISMKSASDNAEKIIDDLRISYNKTRQALITKEISEIVSGVTAI